MLCLGSRDLAVGPVSIASLILGSMLRHEVSPTKEPLLSAGFHFNLLCWSCSSFSWNFKAWIYNRFPIKGNPYWVHGRCCNNSLPTTTEKPSWHHSFTKQMGLVPVLSCLSYNTRVVMANHSSGLLLHFATSCGETRSTLLKHT
ncbi:probable sulfate transporter 3.3 [Telopea speciosissima]|uniref:probable sulfate transporter 3.3 n=1 Tax=Telopea speciosissima TaxID=54955 RepID=UPI001CC59DDC|nr:probable sulfate transporter 3.3 [Telopea speciosissima]